MSSAATPGLRRALRLRDLVFYGIILIQPTAPMPLFGVVGQEARGHVVTTVLIAMFAMLLTALAYGRMARAYPSVGSAYTYVGREIHSGLGFVTGWCMLMEYVLNPITCTIWCAKAAGNIVPEIPFAAWAVFFALLFTALNLRGIKATARTNELLVVAMCAVITWFFIDAARYIFALPHVDWVQPFYDPATFSWRRLSTGTSIAVLTYIGFDGISTLSEEVENPRRNILLATVLTCLLTGLFATAQVYAAQLVWPDYSTYPDADTAFVHVAGRAGGRLLFHLVNGTLLVATIGSGMGSQLGAARLLYGMGRDDTLPRRFFGVVEAKHGIPRNSVLFTGVVVLGGAFMLSYQAGVELVNFGAFVAFMGVNAAAFLHAWRGKEPALSHLLPPLAGFAICFFMWVSLRTPALVAGFIWTAVGVAWAAWKTGGFRRRIEFSEGQE